VIGAALAFLSPVGLILKPIGDFLKPFAWQLAALALAAGIVFGAFRVGVHQERLRGAAAVELQNTKNELATLKIDMAAQASASRQIEADRLDNERLSLTIQREIADYERSITRNPSRGATRNDVDRLRRILGP
jgi:hypothetical protein